MKEYICCLRMGDDIMPRIGKVIKHIGSFKDEYGPVVRNSALMRVFAAGFISSFGSKISYFALLKKVYEMSGGSITNLGFLTIVESLPYIIFGVFAGVIIDRVSRKMVMIVSDVLSACITVSFIFVKDINFIYVIAFMASFVYVFRNPAQSSFEPNLVKKEDIPLMNSFESSVSNLNMIVGSAIGAAIVGFTGTDNAFIIDGLTFLISGAIIFTISIKEKHLGNTGDNKEKGYLKNFTRGVSIVFKNARLKLMLIIDLYVTFAMAMQGPLIYFFIRESLNMGDKSELAWGILLSSLGIGAVIGSFGLGLLVKKYKNRFKLFLNVLMFDAVFFTAFLLNSYFPLSVAIFAFLGCIGTAHMIILNTVIQDTVEDQNRGKVFSAFSMLKSPITILSIFVGTTAAVFITAKDTLLIVAGVEALIAIGVRLTKTYGDFNRTEVAEKTVSQ